MSRDSIHTTGGAPVASAASGSLRLVALLAAALLVATRAPAEAGRTDTVRGRFYRGLPYGTEAQFNPLSAVLNEGFDIGQLHADRGGKPLVPEARDFARLHGTLSHPAASIARGPGWRRFLATELLPLSSERDRAQWVPNYQIHLLGGGLLNARLEEWYVAQGCRHPKTAAFATSMAAAYLNEVQEIGGMGDDAYATDPLADLLVFDLAGIAVFQSEAVRDFFAARVEWMNWPLQPTLWLPDRRVRHAGQYHAFRIPLPGSRGWRLFYHLGLGNIGGFSRRIRDGDWISVGAGYYAVRQRAVDADQTTVDLAPKLGIFWDRNSSLLASLFLNGQSQERMTLNLHPGAVPGMPFGGWLALGGAHGIGLGLVSPMGVGLVPRAPRR